MNLLGEKVKSQILGVGTIIGQEDAYITVEFLTKVSKFPYPSAFEKFLRAEDAAIQAEIDSTILEQKKAAADKKEREAAVFKATEELKKSHSKTSSSRVSKKAIDELFSKDYHVEYLKRHPILTYKEVEKHFGISISGFGRGINSTPTTIILISSISKSAGKFVYHDKWTADGDYLYSGEGRVGDQTLTKGNLAITNAERDGKKIHLFVKFSPQEYYYQGEFKLVDYSYENEKDKTGNIRKEYKLRLRKNIIE